LIEMKPLSFIKQVNQDLANNVANGNRHESCFRLLHEACFFRRHVPPSGFRGHLLKELVGTGKKLTQLSSHIPLAHGDWKSALDG
jgi:hypothetical protein